VERGNGVALEWERLDSGVFDSALHILSQVVTGDIWVHPAIASARNMGKSRVARASDVATQPVTHPRLKRFRPNYRILKRLD